MWEILCVVYLEVTCREVLSCGVQLEGFSLPCLSPAGCFINAKCGAGLLPSFPLVTSCTKLPWYHSNWGAGRVLGFEGFVFSLLPPFGYICYDQNTMLFSVFLSEGYWTRCLLPPLLQALYRLYFITCSLLLILPIHVLSLTQLLLTRSLLSSPSCLLILSVNPSYQFGIQKRQAVSFLHELRAAAHPC